MHNYTREDILRLVEEEDVAFIRLQFTASVHGYLRNHEEYGCDRQPA